MRGQRRIPPLLELDDIQGFLRHSYPYFGAAAYRVFQIENAALVKTWLRELLNPTRTPADPVPDPYLDRASSGRDVIRRLHYGVTLAFTARGLERLGLAANARETFVAEFQEGMVNERRSRLLGDTEENGNAPRGWSWGGREPVDGLLIVFARPRQLQQRLDEVLDIADGLRVVRSLTGILALEPRTRIGREPFGFVDGISQPYIEGLTAKAPPDGVRALRPGEFVLGYRNAIGRLPASPSVAAADDPHERLPRLSIGRADLGRNGTFLVMRELQQHVAEFDAFVGGDEHLAARMVGRWRNGAPLVSAARRHQEITQAELEAGNGFGYHAEDRHGFRCPIGSHIRRANPRDALADGLGITPEEAQELVDQHRILRRGRAYDDNGARGLVFICLNANIDRQFEFVQSSWIMHPEFGGLQGEYDPLLGPGGTMTIQNPLLGQCVDGLQQFVTVRGGAYFFLPGLRAINYLANLP